MKPTEPEIQALIDFNKKLARDNLSENGDVDRAIIIARRAKEWAVYGQQIFRGES